MIRVLVVSPTAAGRTALEKALRLDRGLALVRGRRMRQSVDIAIEEEHPDVVVLDSPRDYQLPVGLRLEQREGLGAAPVVVLLDDLEHETAAWALRAGARAVVPRGAAPEVVGAAVHAAAAGLSSLPATLAPAVLGAAERAPAPPESVDPTLTAREGEVLTLLGEGLGNKEIGVRLRISEHTVKTHLAAIYEKLGASNRAEAVANGLRRGLILL